VRGETVAQGRFIDNQDVSDHEPVVVLGSVTASELFSRVDPVGQTVDVKRAAPHGGGRAQLGRLLDLLVDDSRS